MKSFRLFVLALFALSLLNFASCSKADDEVLQTIGSVEFTRIELNTIAEKLYVSTPGAASYVTMKDNNAE